MGQVRIRQEVSRDGGGFVWEGELASEVGRPPHKQDRPIGQGEGDTGQWLGGEEGAQGGEIGELQEETCAARVCNEGEGGDGAQDLRGMCAGLGEINRGRGGFVGNGQQLKTIGGGKSRGSGSELRVG